MLGSGRKQFRWDEKYVRESDRRNGGGSLRCGRFRLDPYRDRGVVRGSFFCDGLEEVADTLLEADVDGVGDERVTDIEGVEVGKWKKIGKIGEAKAVAGVDLNF